MMSALRLPLSPRLVSRHFALLLAVLAAIVVVARPHSQGSTYTVHTAEGQVDLPVRASGNVHFVALSQIASIFGLTVTEDALVGGLTVSGRGQTILLIPEQSFASIGPGRIVSLPAPVERDGDTWFVPVDFLRLAVGPALDTPIQVRRASRRVIVGDVALPQVTTHFERQGPAGRLIIDIQPGTPHQISRQGNRVTVQFDAAAVDVVPADNLDPEFVSSVAVDGTALQVDLGPAVASYRAEDRSPTQLHLELLAAGPPPGPEPEPTAATPDPGPPPVVEMGTPGMRTIVIDPGHGGDDSGVIGQGGTTEKEYVLTFARRLKNTIESRIGLRVLLTRDQDVQVALDRRAALANNNKADLFISLHANASMRPEVRGAQVLSLRLDDYGGRSAVVDQGDVRVPVLGGGTRAIEVLPWDTAQIGFTQQSRSVADILRRHLATAGIAMLDVRATELALRPLVGVSMPAVMIELGMLSNLEDERALNSSEVPSRMVDAILATIGEIRQGIPAPAPVPEEAQ